MREMLHEAWDIAGKLTKKAEADIDWLIDNTPEKLDADELIPGYTALNDLMPGVPKLLRRWWGFKYVIRPQNTDYGNAQRLVEQHGEDIRHMPQWGRWLIWQAHTGGSTVRTTWA